MMMKTTLTFISIPIVILAIVGFVLINGDSNKDTNLDFSESDKTKLLQEKFGKQSRVIDSLINPEGSKSFTEKEKETYELSKADFYVIEKWRDEIGSSPDQINIYREYDKGTIYELAKQGDIYAMQHAGYLLMAEAKHKQGNEMLKLAAAHGSIQALIYAAIAIKTDYDSFKEGYRTIDDINRMYGTNINSEEELTENVHLVMATHYLVAAARGSVFSGHAGLRRIQRTMINRDFTKDEWKKITVQADKLYHSIEQQRLSLGFDEFDNNYPSEYAAQFGLPKENTLLADLKKHLKLETEGS